MDTKVSASLYPQKMKFTTVDSNLWTVLNLKFRVHGSSKTQQSQSEREVLHFETNL